ncbi:uncharacterized protein LOC114666204 isoform X7 [Erpetoichthys calabaricus]|uniref:uncharacterized protein LOC114666204 isoform X5 n=1 Tax=Erpetoichthys calabaricus TaxID=27687 RepID=UPI002234B2EB|nr:uncharacterized protein LOC114666204 isoform X5 [Erpetoichthys calabaricus]XP_051780992.1 uncharacterized protein LOC114666204 isoform X7 [Erpetoichthys calabaricus]
MKVSFIRRMKILALLWLFGIGFADLCVIPHDATNIARQGIAEQSSPFGNHGLPNLAIDGKRSGVWNDGTCTHTSNDSPSWWRLNLKASHAISVVVVYNRLDCCDTRLTGAEVRVGETPDVATHVKCGTIEATSPGSVHTICCNGKRGQFVSVVLPNQPQHLTLCEVEVYGEEMVSPCTPALNAVNIARQGIAEQSSPFGNIGLPSQAIDGKRSGVWNDGTCTHTSNDSPSWWRLNLKASYTISTVVVYNRLDCCDTRLTGAEVRVGDSPDVSKHVRCGTIEVTFPGSVHTICCNDLIGQYVSVVLPNQPQYLTLCEVEVYGEAVTPECKPGLNAINIARQGTAEQSSPYLDFGGPNLAIDGKRSGVFSDWTCTHTSNDSPSWWRLKLKASYDISTVVVYNRLDCCDTRLMGAEVRVGDSPDVSKHVKCGVIETTSPGSVHTICCNGKRGQFVSIVLPNPDHLTLCEVEVYGEEVVPPCKPALNAINIATGGLAEQSSQYAHGGAPDLVIDGKRNADSFNRSCSQTEITYPSWWRVNLKAVYAVSAVVVYNRQDCCDMQLLGAEVRVGATPDVSDHIICGTIEAVYPGSVHTICCNEMKGQYVSVVLPNRADYLSLCEVEVYGEAITPECKPEPNAINIAKQGTADQSSYYLYLGFPSHVIDGNRNGIFRKGSCTHTQKDTPSWWRVNLKATYAVSTVVVYNREDCCDSILMGAEIRVGDSRDVSKQVKCGTITAVYPGSAHTICCYGMKGQFVSVVLPNQYLTLCEVEVYGEPVPTECAPARNAINLARRGTAEQSSFYGSMGAANHAIDGRTDGDFNYRSCTHTGLESSPWLRVNLRATYAISSVVVYNRQDCCDGRLNGAEIRIGDSPDVSEHVRCGTIEATYPGSVHTICCHGRRGQYVSVVLPNQPQYLTLCEVEVYGEASD